MPIHKPKLQNQIDHDLKQLFEQSLKEEFDDPRVLPGNRRTCLILGAGASLSSKDGKRFDFPTDSEFFKKAISLSKQYDHIKNLIDSSSPLSKLKEWLFPAKEWEGLGMEDFFTAIDMIDKWLNFGEEGQQNEQIGLSLLHLPLVPFAQALDQINSGQYWEPNRTTSAIYSTRRLYEHQVGLANRLSKDEGTPSFKKLREVFVQLRRDIANLIAAVLVAVDKESREGCCPVLQRYLQDNHKCIEEIAFISFNYELLADRTVFRLWSNGDERKTWQPRHFYLQVFANNYVSQPPTVRMPLFLKLHGSVNWYHSENKETGDKFRSSDNDLKEPTNPDIGQFIKDNAYPALLPPLAEKLRVIEKSPLSPKLGRMWTAALDMLLRTDTWEFIGYRLPDTDFPSEWLFRTALAYRKYSNLELPKIKIFNPDAIKEDADMKLLRVLKDYLSKDDIRKNCCLKREIRQQCDHNAHALSKDSSYPDLI